VAVKVIAPERADDEGFRERFVRESRLAASLDHPNVIPVFEAGDLGGSLALVMRYVDGLDLRAVLLRDGRLDAGRMVGVVGQVASALDAAHRQG
jgi:serine/threonine-protein kinase